MVGESVFPHVERVPVFADVVAADPDWVRAEFDEIVAANFLDSSAPPLRRHPRYPRERPRHPAPPARTDTPSIEDYGDLALTARRVGARERSPPLPAGAVVDPRDDTSNAG